MPGTNSSIESSVTPSNPLNNAHQRFNVTAFNQHSLELGRAGRALERAYHSAYAIECIMSILVSDDTERDHDQNGGQPLSLYLRGGLTAAISQLAAGLHHELCGEADGLDEMLKRAQGGAA